MAKKTSLILVGIATSWGSQHGGINTFNYELLTNIAKAMPENSIGCIVINASIEQKNDAAKNNIILINLGKSSETEYDTLWVNYIKDKLEENYNLRELKWLVGHDVFTGGIALDLKDKLRKGKTAIIMHSSYEDYENIKSRSTWNKNTKSEKTNAQKNIFKKADVCIAIGPLLKERLSEMGLKDPKMLVPGLNVIEGITHSSQKISALIFGRFELGKSRLKQENLAFHGFCKAISQQGDYHSTLSHPSLKLIGVQDVENIKSEVEEVIDEKAGRIFEHSILPYLNDRDTLRTHMEGVNLCMTLSWHEGFGLTAWEAIGAGIPLIISKNTGVYKLLDLIGGAATGCVLPVDVKGSFGKNSFKSEDLDNVVKHIIKVATNIEKHINDAKSLQRLLTDQNNYTWENTVNEFLSLLEIKDKRDNVANVLDSSTASLLDSKSKSVARQENKLISIDLSGKIQIDRLIKKFQLSKSFYRSGQYKKALNEISFLEAGVIADDLTADISLLLSEILLRLNKYKEMTLLTRKIRTYFTGKEDYPNITEDWPRIIKIYGIVNTMQRDIGLYSEAIQTAREMFAESQRYYPKIQHSAMRSLSRSLALGGHWEEAVDFACRASEIAVSREDVPSQAKSYLALGEAHRHGFAQKLARQAYYKAIKLSLETANYDCLLWSLLGLSDSLFLVKEIDELCETSEMIETILCNDEDQEFPLETLHYQLTEISLSIFHGNHEEDGKQDLLNEYAKLGIHWPERYLQTIMDNDYSTPKQL